MSEFSVISRQFSVFMMRGKVRAFAELVEHIHPPLKGMFYANAEKYIPLTPFKGGMALV